MAVRFSADDGFDFAVRCLLNGVPYGMADPGELLTAVGDVPAGDIDAWFDALTGLAARLEAQAAQQRDRGHAASAAGGFLRAANYRFAAFYYVLATRDPDRWLEAWRAHRVSLDAALDLRPGCRRLPVPFDGIALDARLFSSADGGARARPLAIVQGGLGSPLSDALMTGVDDQVARGWCAVAFDGPGQGRARMEDGLGPVDDWERVVAAVLDAVTGEVEVDPERIAVIGIAEGAYLAARAAAHEPRVRAVVCDPGVVRPAAGALAAPDPSDAFAVAKYLEAWPGADVDTVRARMATWDVAAFAPALTVPIFAADPEAAESFPGQSAELERLRPERVTRVPFTTAEGAGLDCEIGAPAVRAARIGDWLDEVFGLDGRDGGST
jgi:hypothetical protein